MTDREKAIVMAYTGYTMLAGDKLGIYYQYVQEKLGRSVMTHELAYEEVQDAIKEAAKEDFIAIAKADNNWISVKKKLPEKPGQYLTVSNSFAGPKLIKTLMFVKDLRGMDPYALERTSQPGWYEWDSEYGYYEYDTVTHWMPLPEPPKEDKHET